MFPTICQACHKGKKLLANNGENNQITFGKLSHNILVTIPYFLDTSFANNRAGERRGKARFDYAERRRLKPKVNPAASAGHQSC